MAGFGSGPLAGLRVLELAQFAAGPFPALLQPISRRRGATAWIVDFEAAGQIRAVTLPGGKRVPTVGNALRMTGYEFEVRHNPPRLAEHQDEVFHEWLA